MSNSISGKLATLPDNPGVYIMRGSDGEVIYVGKAKNLKNRVRQYFQSGKNHTAKVAAMVQNISDFEYIVTDSELEALVLECNLIKKHRPKYNIQLKDDKRYPFIRINAAADFPKIRLVRKVEDDNAKYFGPYLNATLAGEMIDIVKNLFGVASCSRNFPRDIAKGRPCLNYHIKQCMGVCSGGVLPGQYKKAVRQAMEFLSGKRDGLVSELEAEMRILSENLEFERAARLRDKIQTIEKISEKQKMMAAAKNEQDFIALATDGSETCVQLFTVRDGKLLGRENFSLKNTANESLPDIVSEFIKQYYSQDSYIPKEIYIQCDTEERGVLQSRLSALRGGRVAISVPLRGEKREMLDMARANAEQALEGINITRNRSRALLMEIKETLGLKKLAHRIEAFDISNTGGADSVGGMAVFYDGKPKKSDYRKFKIKSVQGADDYSSMREVLYRRLTHALEEAAQIERGAMAEEKAKFLPLPDLILLDGGKGHVSTIKELLGELSLDIPVFGIVKDDAHKTKGITTDKERIEINVTKRAFKFFAAVQDEVHKNAISYHRKLRSKNQTASGLDGIKGVGESRRNALLKHFKSITAIKKATVEELSAVAGISPAVAQNVYDNFHRGG